MGIKDITLFRDFRLFILDKYQEEFTNRPALKEAVENLDDNSEEVKGILAVYGEFMEAKETNTEKDLLALVTEGMETVFEEIPDRFDERIDGVTIIAPN